MFNRQECIDDILASAITYQDDDSTGILCRNCCEEAPDWEIPNGYVQPPSMRCTLCVTCWAEEEADRCEEKWEDEEADRRAAG